MQNYNYTVFVGRMQPFHNGHFKTIKKALEITSDKVIIILGSANKPRDLKNPWTWQERQTMIRDCFNASDNSRIIIQPVEDRLYNNMYWIQSVQQSVDITIRSQGQNPNSVSISLIGHHKDESSWYLDNFPKWKQVEMPNFVGDNELGINATDIRNEYFYKNRIKNTKDGFHETFKDVPFYISDYLNEFAKTECFEILIEEKEFQERHDEMWKPAPYTPTFNTNDAVVFRSGHILLIKRRNTPGKGLWALPGGYLDPKETSLNGAIRELIEETKLKGPGADMLRDKVFSDKVFDHPERSLRGRIITNAWGFNLGQGDLLKVKGADDALKAKWFTLNEVVGMRDQIFEDHADIIEYFVARMDEFKS